MQPSISLKELLQRVKHAIGYSFPSTYWISADISDFHEDAYRGHCYLELVEKNDDKLIEAKVRAAIWSNTYAQLKRYFFQETGEHLASGMKVLVEVSISFHEQYGLSFIIQNIDPTFTVGDIARKRQETIRRLKEDGVLDMNHELRLPMLLHRIAVISSESAAGYGDFCNQLQTNYNGIPFDCRLFPAIMQGEAAAGSIVNALDEIYACAEEFDIVVIIRGGGASTDLLAFNDYNLASCVAQFPLPIITGIGHERDESVVDMVANTRCKTPTAVAAFIIDRMTNIEMHLLELQRNIFRILQDSLRLKAAALDAVTSSLVRNFTHRIDMEKQRLTSYRQKSTVAFSHNIKEQKHELELKENTLRLLSPEVLLKRGYSITTQRGKIVKDASLISQGMEIETIFHNGIIRSVVK